MSEKMQTLIDWEITALLLELRKASVETTLKQVDKTGGKEISFPNTEKLEEACDYLLKRAEETSNKFLVIRYNQVVWLFGSKRKHAIPLAKRFGIKLYFLGVKIKLSQSEYDQLRQIQKHPGLPRREYRKVTVLIMLHQKHSISLIEAALGLDDNTIRRYAKTYLKKGFAEFIIDGFIPYSGKLSEEQIALLCTHLDEYLYEDAAAICRYVETTFGIVYSVSGMTQLLHRMGYVYKQTKPVPSKASEQDQLDFLDDVLPKLLEQAEQGDAVVYYADGVHPTHNTKAGRGWIRKGRDFEVDCNSGRKRVNINGAINALKPEHLVYDITDSINAQSTQRLCRQLLRKHPKKTVYLICDNARYNRNKLLQQWAEGQRIKFVFLPPYSPNLNLIERLWKFMRKKAISSIYYDTYSKFKEGIIDFLENIKDYKSELRRLLTLNFRSVGGTSVYAQTT